MGANEEKRQDQRRGGWLPPNEIAKEFGVSETWVRTLITGNYVQHRLVKLDKHNKRGLRFVSVASLNNLIETANQEAV